MSIEASDLEDPQLDENFIYEKLNHATMNIKEKLAQLKEKEINRIFSHYINKDIEEKSLRSLNKILISLFGRANAEKIYGQFIRLKQVTCSFIVELIKC